MNRNAVYDHLVLNIDSTHCAVLFYSLEEGKLCKMWITVVTSLLSVQCISVSRDTREYDRTAASELSECLSGQFGNKNFHCIGW